MRGARKTADASWRGVESAGKPWTWVRCGMIGTRRCEGVGLLISGVLVFEDSFDHIDIGDERVDAHVAAAVSVTNAVRIAGPSAASPAAADTPQETCVGRSIRRLILLRFQVLFEKAHQLTIEGDPIGLFRNAVSFIRKPQVGNCATIVTNGLNDSVGLGNRIAWVIGTMLHKQRHSDFVCVVDR